MNKKLVAGSDLLEAVELKQNDLAKAQKTIADLQISLDEAKLALAEHLKGLGFIPAAATQPAAEPAKEKGKPGRKPGATSKGGSQTQLVYEALAKAGPLMMEQLEKATGLKPSAINQIFAKTKKAGKPIADPDGKRPATYTLNKKFKLEE